MGELLIYFSTLSEGLEAASRNSAGQLLVRFRCFKRSRLVTRERVFLSRTLSRHSYCQREHDNFGESVSKSHHYFPASTGR